MSLVARNSSAKPSSVHQLNVSIALNHCTVRLIAVDWLTPNAPIAITWMLYCPEGVTGLVGCEGENEPLPPQPVNPMPAPQTTRADIIRSHALHRLRRLAASRASIPGTNAPAQRTASAFLCLSGTESSRASPPVPTVNTVLAAVVPPENVIEAG